MEPLELPKYVDDPPLILLWRIDDLAPLVFSLVLGILTDRLWLFLLIGLLGVRLYGKFRDSRPDGYALHLLYWLGVYPMSHRSTPNPFARWFHP